MEIVAMNVMGDSGLEYQVTTGADGETVTCTCPAFLYGEGPCKHIKYVISRLSALVT